MPRRPPSIPSGEPKDDQRTVSARHGSLRPSVRCEIMRNACEANSYLNAFPEQLPIYHTGYLGTDRAIHYRSQFHYLSARPEDRSI